MSSDIVKRLRGLNQSVYVVGRDARQIIDDAADEIERLRDLLAEIEVLAAKMDYHQFRTSESSHR